MSSLESGIEGVSHSLGSGAVWAVPDAPRQKKAPNAKLPGFYACACAAQAAKWVGTPARAHALRVAGVGSIGVGVGVRAAAGAGAGVMGGAAGGDGNTSGGANASGAAEGAGQIQKEIDSRSLGGKAGAFDHPDGTHRTSPHALTRVRSGHRAPGHGRVVGARGPQGHQHPARTPQDAPGVLEQLPWP